MCGDGVRGAYRVSWRPVSAGRNLTSAEANRRWRRGPRYGRKGIDALHGLWLSVENGASAAG